MSELPFLRFRDQPEAAGLLRRWHDELQSRRGARAALRRVRDLDDVWPEEAYSRLRLPLMKRCRFGDEALARAAVAVAEVDEPRGAALAQRLAAVLPPKDGHAAPRVRLLLGAEDPDEFLRLLRATLQQMERRVDIVDLADTVLAWGAASARTVVRRRLMLAYYDHAAGLETETKADVPAA